jgi:hypothetical protein
MKYGDDYVTFLSGNVHFFYDDIEFLSDRAEIYERERYVVLRGNVVAIQDTLRITCDEARYLQEQKLLRLMGNVVMREIHDTTVNRRVTSDNAVHFRETGVFELMGSVYAHDVSDSLYATAGYVFYDQNEGYGYMLQNPTIWRTGADSLSLSAQKIEFFEPIQKLVASFNVVTQNKDIVAMCDFLIYYGEEDKVIYIGDPRFYTENGDGSAELITIFLEKNDIREIHLENECHIVFRTAEDSPKNSWIESTNMILYYENNKPTLFVANTSVKSHFIQINRNNNREQNNFVTGDELNITFDEDSNVVDVRINSNVSGMYRFQRR